MKTKVALAGAVGGGSLYGQSEEIWVGKASLSREHVGWGLEEEKDQLCQY